MKDVAVRFDSVSFSYGDIAAKGRAATGAYVHILENASFHIHRGEFAAMVGPNGSGKTTVLKLLFGLETPSAGNIELFGIPCGSGRHKLTKLAYVPQGMPADNMFPITVRDIVRMGLLRPFKGYPQESAAVTEALERTGIADLAARPYYSLSGGQKRRALAARALAAKPELLVLDEPTANMDMESETMFYETLAFYKGKTTILIVTHDTEFVTSLTDRVLCLGDGSRTVVQHKTEKPAAASGCAASARHGGSRLGTEVRVLHGENISADACCPAIMG